MREPGNCLCMSLPHSLSLPCIDHKSSHLLGTNSFCSAVREALQSGGRRLQRAIGVIYRPDTERQSHMFFADIGSQFDIAVFFDRTHALQSVVEQVSSSVVFKQASTRELLGESVTKRNLRDEVFEGNVRL